MLKKNLVIKYQELQKDLSFSKFTLVANDDGTIYYSKDGKSASESTLQKYSTKGFRAKISAELAKKGYRVIAIFSSPNTLRCGELGGIPTMLDDFTEIFGGNIVAVEKDEKKILKAIKKRNAVIVKDNCVILTARSLDEAGTMSRIIEKNAFVMLKAKWFVTINPFISKCMNIGYTSYYSKINQQRVWQKEKTELIETVKINPITIDDIEKADKKTQDLLVAKKLYQDNYTQGTWGNVSIKIDDKTLYCTPKAIGYNLLKEDDIVTMNYLHNKQLSKGNKATSEKGIHCRVMRERKDSYVVVHAHPTYSSIFAARNQNLEVSDSGKAVLGDIVYCSKHALPMTKRLANNTVDSMKTNAVFMGNHGVAVYGKDIREVFLVIETLEKEAKQALI